MPQMDLLLEAERRGILPEDKKALLQEARTRGLVPALESPAQPPAAQNHFLEAPQGETQLSQDHPMGRAISQVARPLLETGGLAAGGLIGGTAGTLGAGPVGTAAGGLLGAGLGYAGGKSLADALDELMNVRLHEHIQEKLGRIPSDVAQGATMEAGGGVVGKAVVAPIAKALAPLAERMGPEATARMNLANETGFPATSADITRSKATAKAENFLRDNPGSAGKIGANDLAQYEALQAAKENIASQYGPAQKVEDLGASLQEGVQAGLANKSAMQSEALGRVRDAVKGKVGQGDTASALEAGTGAQAALKKENQAANAVMGDEYSSLPIEKTTVVPTPNLERQAGELLDQYSKSESAFQDPTVKDLLKSLSSPKTRTWEEIQILRQNLNALARSQDAAYRMGQGGYKGLSSPEGGIAKKIQGALTSDIQAHSDATGGTLKPAFDSATNTAKEFYRLFGDRNIKQVLNSNPETIVDKIFRPGHTTEATMLRKAIGDEGMRPLKNQVIDKILEAPSIQKGIDKYGPDTLGASFTSEEMKTLNVMAGREAGIVKQRLSAPILEKIAKADPAKVFDTILESTTGKTIERVDAANLARLNLLSPYFGKNGKDAIASKMMDRAIDLNGDKPFNPTSALKIFNSFGPRTAEALLGKDGVAQMRTLGKLSEMSRGAQKIAGNPSGTGQSVISAGYFGLIVRGVERAANDLFHANVGSAIAGATKTMVNAVLLPQGAAKLYLSPLGRKWLTTGLQLPAGSEAGVALSAKILEIAGKDGYKIEGDSGAQP